MKRRLPTSSSLAKVSILLLSCAAHAKKDKENECSTIQKAAQLYDADGSGGLSRTEFTQYWYGLGDTSGGDNGTDEAGGDAIMMFMPPSVSDMYTDLLCQCHDTFGNEESCCDDTATDDEVSTTADLEVEGEGKPGKGNGNTPNEIWTEVPLTGFDQVKPKGDTKEYMKEFCWYVQDALEKEGVTLNPDMNVTVSAATTVAATEAPGSTTGATMPVTTTLDLISAQPQINWTLINETDSMIVTTTEATTTTATTEPTTTTEATTTTSEPTTTEMTTVPEELGPIILRFVGSTDGKVMADSVELNDVTHAFWFVTLEVLDDIFSRMRLLSNGRRNLEWDFGEQASVFFESVNMEVKDMNCPEGLVYAAVDSSCIQFKYTLSPLPAGPLTAGIAEEFKDSFYTSVNENGALYDFLVEEYDDTEIIGMGNPGKGVPFDPNGINTIETVILGSQGSANPSTKSVQGSGFPLGGIIGIAVAAALLALILVGFAVRRRQNKRRQSQQELNDSNLSEDLEANEVNEDAANVEEWLDEEEHEEPGMGGVNARVGTGGSPASSLAAMGVASTVATRLTTGDTEVMMTEKQPWTKNEPVV